MWESFIVFRTDLAQLPLALQDDVHHFVLQTDLLFALDDPVFTLIRNVLPGCGQPPPDKLPPVLDGSHFTFKKAEKYTDNTSKLPLS